MRRSQSPTSTHQTTRQRMPTLLPTTKELLSSLCLLLSGLPICYFQSSYQRTATGVPFPRKALGLSQCPFFLPLVILLAISTMYSLALWRWTCGQFQNFTQNKGFFSTFCHIYFVIVAQFLWHHNPLLSKHKCFLLALKKIWSCFGIA